MNIPRNVATMIHGGAIAGLLSGVALPLPMSIRGAGFGTALSLSLCLIQKFGWKRSYGYLPGIVIGTLLGLFPFEFSLSEENIPYRYDYITVINCIITTPLLVYAYRSNTWKKRIFLMISIGLLSCIFRSYAIDRSADAIGFVLFNFPAGMLPFLTLWTGFMRLTDLALKKTPQPPK